jgi:hypothetical protein
LRGLNQLLEKKENVSNERRKQKKKIALNKQNFYSLI